MNTRWIVTAVDYGESCDGKAVVLGAFKTKDEAEAYVKSEMDRWLEANEDEGAELDYDSMSAHYDYDSGNGCEWQISEIDIEL